MAQFIPPYKASHICHYPSKKEQIQAKVKKKPYKKTVHNLFAKKLL